MTQLCRVIFEACPWEEPIYRELHVTYRKIWEQRHKIVNAAMNVDHPLLSLEGFKVDYVVNLKFLMHHILTKTKMHYVCGKNVLKHSSDV